MAEEGRQAIITKAEVWEDFKYACYDTLKLYRRILAVALWAIAFLSVLLMSTLYIVGEVTINEAYYAQLIYRAKLWLRPSTGLKYGAFGKTGELLTLSGDEAKTFAMKNLQTRMKEFPDGLPHPIVLRGAADDWPAVKKWASDEYFLSLPNIHDITVSAEPVKKEDRGLSSKRMSFDQFLHIYEESDVYMVSDVPKPMLEDLLLPAMLRCDELLNNVEGRVVTGMWISSGGTASVVHTDDLDNILCSIRGEKELVISPPREAFYGLVELTNQFSSMDVNNVDLALVPALRNATFLRATLRPGDCVFIPFHWLHQVRSFGSNIGVNVFWESTATLYKEELLEQCDDNEAKNIDNQDSAQSSWLRLASIAAESTDGLYGAGSMNGDTTLFRWGSLIRRANALIDGLPGASFDELRCGAVDVALVERLDEFPALGWHQYFARLFSEFDVNDDMVIGPSEADMASAASWAKVYALSEVTRSFSDALNELLTTAEDNDYGQVRFSLELREMSSALMKKYWTFNNKGLNDAIKAMKKDGDAVKTVIDRLGNGDESVTVIERLAANLANSKFSLSLITESEESHSD